MMHKYNNITTKRKLDKLNKYLFIYYRCCVLHTEQATRIRYRKPQDS